MSKIGGLWGALLGGTGVAAYYNGIDSGSLLGHLLSPGWGSGQQRWAAAGRNSELDDLYKLVERLSRDVKRSQGGGVTVIHGSNGSSAIFTYGGVILVSTLGVMYIRGWKISDFFYVTRAGLQKSMSGVTQSVEGLTQRMNSIRQFVASQLDSVKRRQEESMKAQGELKSQVHTDLMRLGDNMKELTLQQSTTAEGIHLLCSVVGELMKSVNYRSQSTSELQKFLKRANNGKTMGLEGLVGNGGEEQQLPQLPQPSGARKLALQAMESDSLDNLDSPDMEHISPPKLRQSNGAKPWGAPSGGGWTTFMARANSSTQP